jgi:hypothetical protein
MTRKQLDLVIELPLLPLRPLRNLEQLKKRPDAYKGFWGETWENFSG